MRKLTIILSLVIGCIGYCYLLGSCKKNDVVKAPTTVSITVPDGFPQPHYDFTANPLTKEGIELGRHLFYDGQLSKDGNFPCSSCHQQYAAFATYDHDLSHGYNNTFTTRNTPGLANLAWLPSYQWDGGTANIDNQVLAHITASNEMAETIEEIIGRLKNDNSYKPLFRAAFGDEEINSQRILKALSQFSLTLVAGNSKYDRVKKGQDAFSSQEAAGYQFFKANCAACHAEPMFTDYSFRNNGLTLDPALKDIGRMRVTGNSSDSLKFRVPSLRNVYITGPYMHDGRFWFISQVMEHYNSGITPSPTLDPLLKNGIK